MWNNSHHHPHPQPHRSRHITTIKGRPQGRPVGDPDVVIIAYRAGSMKSVSANVSMEGDALPFNYTTASDKPDAG